MARMVKMLEQRASRYSLLPSLGNPCQSGLIQRHAWLPDTLILKSEHSKSVPIVMMTALRFMHSSTRVASHSCQKCFLSRLISYMLHVQVGKSWLENPQIRVYLNWDKVKKQVIKDGPIKEAKMTVVVSTAIPLAEAGLHLLRNKICAHHNEHLDVLAQRYHHLVSYTEQYEARSEICM